MQSRSKAEPRRQLERFKWLLGLLTKGSSTSGRAMALETFMKASIFTAAAPCHLIYSHLYINYII